MKAVFKKVIVAILTWESKMVLKRYKPKVVAVTGNVGKTSAKDAIYTAISKFFFVRKSEKSFNSEIGIPLTILGLPNAWNNPLAWIVNILKGLGVVLLPNHYPVVLVLEIGADRPGDIKKVSGWLKPDAVVVTSFSKVPVHVEFFSSREELIKEKGYIVKALKKDGVLILNHDDVDAMSYASDSFIKPITYGFSEGSDVLASNYKILYTKDASAMPEGITFKVDHVGSCLPVVMKGVLGIQHVYPALAGIALGAAMDCNSIEISEALSAHIPPRGRMNIVRGIKNSCIIDDSYNSSPLALEQALETLAKVETKGRKIAVLGDMLELGKHSIDEHKNLGKKVAKVADILVTVGVRGRFFAEGASSAKMARKKIFIFETSSEAGEFVKGELEDGDVVLIKGSQGVRMEKVAEAIILDPSRKKDLLVRQELEWENR